MKKTLYAHNHRDSAIKENTFSRAELPNICKLLDQLNLYHFSSITAENAKLDYLLRTTFISVVSTEQLCKAKEVACVSFRSK